MRPQTHALIMTITCALIQGRQFNLTILHLNDFHASFEETSVTSSRCTPTDARANRCYGGMARIHTKVKEVRATDPNVLFMAAGDYYQGTVWYTIHRWRILAHFLAILQQDVMSLGNHEFDDGVPGLVSFLDSVSFPVLAANIDVSQEPSMKGKVQPSVVFTKGGTKIGVIGYVTHETASISNPGRVIFLDEAESVKKEASKLKQEGVGIIIALGHAGYKKDQEVATAVPDIDIVVGGHTNTFLYTGSAPSTESQMGAYPTVVVQASGRKVLVVQAYAFGKYLGLLRTTFDAQGEIISWEGNPVLLDNAVVQDPYVLKELEPWKQTVQSVITETLGRTFVFLDGARSSCRMKECNLGNLLTDAIVHMNARYPDGLEWSRTSLAVMVGGGIRASIDEQASNGSISMEDVINMAPFQNTIDIVKLKGRHVRQMFEHSVSKYDPAAVALPEAFLQISGFRVVYDVSLPSGSRVVSLKARCDTCRVPFMEDVLDDQVYKIAMLAFVAHGGDGYAVVRDHKVAHHRTGLLDTDVFSQYIRLQTPIYQGIEGRIMFRESTTGVCPVSVHEIKMTT